jgi:hypothetical protein
MRNNVGIYFVSRTVFQLQYSVGMDPAPTGHTSHVSTEIPTIVLPVEKRAFAVALWLPPGGLCTVSLGPVGLSRLALCTERQFDVPVGGVIAQDSLLLDIRSWYVVTLLSTLLQFKFFFLLLVICC